GLGRQGSRRDRRAAGLPARAPVGRGDRRRSESHRLRTGRQGPGRHGQGDGRREGEAGGEGRYGPGVGGCESGVGRLKTEPPYAKDAKDSRRTRKKTKKKFLGSPFASFA